jgi:AcrR family transcriptional regulator
MARQVRSEATRQKIISAAVHVFGEVGYPASGLSDIINRAEMTKGALYHHFDSKESVAAAIMEEGAAAALGTFRRICESRSPALENVIHGVFVVADLVARNKVIRTGIQLTLVLGGSNRSVAPIYKSWLEATSSQITKAAAEGDIRADLDLGVVAESVIAALLGMATLVSSLAATPELVSRLNGIWEILLPAIVAEESLPYFREFLARESLRNLQPTLLITDTDQRSLG